MKVVVFDCRGGVGKVFIVYCINCGIGGWVVDMYFFDEIVNFFLIGRWGYGGCVGWGGDLVGWFLSVVVGYDGFGFFFDGGFDVFVVGEGREKVGIGVGFRFDSCVFCFYFGGLLVR